jgi:hypothetical protein
MVMAMNVKADRYPVAIFLYKRWSFLPEILSRVAAARPPMIYLFLNAPSCEEEKCDVGRVYDQVRLFKPDTDVRIVFRDRHCLINESIVSAVDHVFSEVDAAIFLEDDTVPSAGFFEYCNVMLGKHRDDLSVASINGCNLDAVCIPGKAFRVPFSVFNWGWATWRDRWSSGFCAGVYPDQSVASALSALTGATSFFERYIPRLDGRAPWDISWSVARLKAGHYTVLPGINLVSNRGFDMDGTYTRYTGSAFESLSLHDWGQGAGAKLHSDAGVSKAYEVRTASLLLEILRSKGQLGHFSLDDHVVDMETR